MVEFQPSREDGRSDRQVVYTLAVGAAPETTFDYDQLAKALLEGLPDGTPVDRRRVYRAVASANKDLLRQEKRYLSVVKNVGYRVIRAEEHLPAAMARKSSAVEQLAKGIELLRHVRLDEIPEIQRKLHEGQLMIMASLHTSMVESERRHDRNEAVIDAIRAQQAAITQRLDALEGNID